MGYLFDLITLFIWTQFVYALHYDYSQTLLTCLVLGITTTGEIANLTAPTSNEVVTSNTETGLNGEEEEPHPILVSGNAASSSFVNSPILHRQKRMSPYRNGRTFLQYNSRNRLKL